MLGPLGVRETTAAIVAVHKPPSSESSAGSLSLFPFNRSDSPSVPYPLPRGGQRIGVSSGLQVHMGVSDRLLSDGSPTPPNGERTGTLYGRREGRARGEGYCVTCRNVRVGACPPPLALRRRRTSFNSPQSNSDTGSTSCRGNLL
ncbi:hypothetical protein EVAR_99596_1 [Eumeta japonica]|uniref:Uncharacterized protein n=1 Tax=Eumeta variegata TaxID=151549 RepID=A0A4C1ZV09_EUMVA|nr:hypothetical protein EVAR_99596_1 [Eumeta japonica]